MIEAWLSASEMMASSGPRMVSKRPALASKQLVYRMVSSVPEGRDRVFEPLVLVLSSADEPHRREPEAVLVHGVFRGPDELRVVGEPEVVVRAEVEDRLRGDLNLRGLVRHDDALVLVEAGIPNGVEFLA